MLVMLGIVMMLVTGSPAWASPASPSALPTSAASLSLDDLDLDGDLDGGACGDEEEQPEELIYCTTERSVFDRPSLLDLLAQSIERMTPGQCRKLLDDLYEREVCRVGGRECGDLLPVGALPIAPKSNSNSSSSAQSWLERLALAEAGSRVVGPRASNDRTPHARAIAPLDRPPRSLLAG